MNFLRFDSMAKKVNKTDHLKRISAYLTSNTINVNDVLNKHNTPYFKQRIISYLIKYPNLIHFINNYLNSKYKFEKYSNVEWLETFKLIFEKNNIKKTNQLYFARYKQTKRNVIKSELEEYLDSLERINNDNDLNELFRLNEAKIIDDSFIDYIKEINSGKPVGKTKNIDIEIDSAVNKQNENEIIDKLNKKIKNYIQNRLLCKNCPLFNQPKYPVYSNAIDKKVDCIVVGDFPTSENSFNDNQYLNLIKTLLNQFDISYALTNLVLCKPKYDEIPNKSKTISNCSGVTEHVYNSFNPQFKILIGSNVKSFFKIKGTITKLNGEVINNNFIIVNPDTNINQYKNGLIKLKEFLTKYNKEKINRINMEKGLVKSDSFKNINSSLNKYTLFDIKIIEEKILYILIDDKGSKKYITEDISYPVYIKQGKYSDCSFMLDTEPDLVVYLTNQQKIYLNNILNKKLHRNINLC